MVRISLQWFRFAVVGVTNTLLSTAAYGLLVRSGLQYLAASAIAFALGALNSYALNRRWTFRSSAPRATELGRFLCVQLIGLGTNLASLALLVDGAHIPRLAAQLLVFPLASLVTFGLSRQWAFKGSQQMQAAGTG